MKELIDKLSLGVTEYIKPEVEADIDRLSLKMETEKIHKGSFKLISTNGKTLKGIVYSTDNRLIIDNDQFIGSENIINYTINTEYVNQNEEIKGFINIVSNGGEISIPFEVDVDSVSAETSIGSVKNLFHFANLVQTSYEEAVKLFIAPSFTHIFLENDLKLMAVYNALIGSRDINCALEEFLVAANKKKPINISVSEQEKEYGNIEENYGDAILVSKDTWGYVNISIETAGDFIHVDRDFLTSSDFAGNNYELSYYIDKSKLHAGKNAGRIRLITLNQTLDFNISVVMPSKKNEEKKEYKNAISEIVSNYIGFRMKKTDLNRWVETSDMLISRARGISDSTFMKLLQAHIYLTKGQEEDGAWLLENVAEDLIPKREERVELYCYYLYVRTIQKRDDAFTEEVIRKVKDYFENGYDTWKLLWVLIYLDEIYENNISLKLLRIKEQYMNGMRSPLLYFEALSCLNEVPEMLRVLDEFEIQVLNFGIKNDCINRKLALWVNDLAKTERKFNPLLFKIMTWMYDKYNENEILSSICSMLIKCNKTDEKYFKWFEMGVEKELKITSLYEYYMYTVSMEYEGDIPQMVMMYFAYNSTTLPDEKVDLLYAKVIENKEKLPVIYNTYVLLLEKYVSDNIVEGRMNRYLAVIYKDVLTKAMIGTEIAEKLPEIINTYEISCERSDVREVIIVHKEINETVRYRIKQGKAYVHMYTEDAAVVFEDIKGNRFSRAVEYSKTKLLDIDDYLKMCYEMIPDNRALVLYFGDKYLKYRKNPDKSIAVLKTILRMEVIIKPFKILVEKEVIEYYSHNYDGDSLDEYLLTAEADSLGTPARMKLIEMTIVRGLYERAYELMERYGFYGIESGRIMKCAAKLIELWSSKEEKLLIDMSAFAFTKGKYNETILSYLGTYYNGTTRELLALWKAAKDFECENRELEEKIIVQMLFTGAYVSKIDGIYDSYFKKGVNEKVKKAYLFSKSYDYFVKEKVIEESIFKYIERELSNGDDVNDMCGLAFLKYMSENENISGQQIEMCKTLIYDLVKIGKIFEFYKKFKKYFTLPYTVADKTVVEYKTNPENRVFIHYIMENGNGVEDDYSVTEMEMVCEGVFTYVSVLFYGENLQYYITEESDERVTVTESKNISLNDVEFSNDNTHYGMINDILVCKEMKEEKTFEKMTLDYFEKKELMDMMFEIKK